MPRGNFAAYGALCASVLFWGLSFTATKVALTHLAPFTILFMRFALACAVLAPVAAAGKLRGLGLADHARIFGISILFPGCYFALEAFALRLTSATSASLISAAIPMAVLVLSAAVARERPPLRNVLGVAASLAGVCLLVGLRDGPESAMNTGDALMLGAVASAAVYMVAASRLCRSVSPLALTTLQMFWGTLFFLPFSLPVILAGLPDWSAVPAAPLLAVGSLGLFATVGAFLAYNFALSRVSAQTASLFINAVPVVAVFGAHLALSESVAVTQLAGGAMILASVYATASRPARELVSNTS